MTLESAERHVPQLSLPDRIRVETIEVGPAGETLYPPGFERCVVLENLPIAPEHYRMRLQAPRASTGLPGQFTMVRTAPDEDAHLLLPRPMAVYRYRPDDGEIDLVYRVIGEGTLAMSERRKGERVEIMGPVGTPFIVHPGTRGVLLVGRGIGTCSLMALAEDASRRDLSVYGLLSGRATDVVLGTEVFDSLARKYETANDGDGSSSMERVRPYLAEILNLDEVGQAFVCGANRLVDLTCELAAESGVEVQVSLEAPMACGLGYCHGCATGAFGEMEESPLVCRDGPVFRASRVTA